MVTLDPRFGDLNGKSVALYAFDTVKVSKYVELNGGLRFDRFDVDGVTLANTGLVPTERLDEMVSGAGAWSSKEEGSTAFLLRHLAQPVAGRLVVQHGQHRHRARENVQPGGSAASGI